MRLEQAAVAATHDNLEGDDGLVDKIKKARALGFTGDMCTTCGSMNVKKNGSCNVCIDCGTTTGCS
jgi:ribonucleoside-diphosphate reductase alpha chain